MYIAPWREEGEIPDVLDAAAAMAGMFSRGATFTRAAKAPACAATIAAQRRAQVACERPERSSISSCVSREALGRSLAWRSIAAGEPARAVDGRL